MCKVYTGYCGTSEIEHGLCACTVDNPLAKARGLSLRTGAQPMLYLPHVIYNTGFCCARAFSKYIKAFIHCRTGRKSLYCKTVNYSHVISLNMHTVFNEVKNGFERSDYHCVSQYPSINGWHQFSELKFHSVSSDLYNSQSCCICL